MDKVRNIYFKKEKLQQSLPEHSTTINEIKDDTKPAKHKQKKDLWGFKKGFLFESAPQAKQIPKIRKLLNLHKKGTKFHFVINTNKEAAKSSLVFDKEDGVIQFLIFQMEMEKTANEAA